MGIKTPHHPVAAAARAPRAVALHRTRRFALLAGLTAWAWAPGLVSAGPGEPKAAARGPAVPTLQVAGDTPLRGHALEGSVQPVRQATVSAQVGGAVLALLVRPGDPLRAGQAIARIDERDTEAGLQRGNAELAQAEANWRQAPAC